MKFIIKTPTRAYVYDATDQELKDLKKALSYINTSARFQYNNLKYSYGKSNSDKEWYQERLQEHKTKMYRCILYFDKGYYIAPGSLSYLPKKFKFTVENQIQYPKRKKFIWAKKIPFTPYQHQTDAVTKLIDIKHGHIEYGTGSGKSLILLTYVREMGIPSVILTPSKSIARELYVLFQTHLGKSLVGLFGDGKKEMRKITIAINRSVSLVKPNTKAWDHFSQKQVMAVDEAHTFSSTELEKTNNNILKDVPFRIYCSGTILRGDGGEKLLYSIVGPCVAKLSVKDAIEQGFLCPLKFKIIKTTSSRNQYIKDSAKNQRIHLLRNDNVARLVGKTASALWKVKQESSLILVRELSQIANLLKYIPKDISVGYVHSGSKKDADKVGINKVNLTEEVLRFNKGETKILIGTSSIWVGTNLYPTHNVFNAFGSTSETYIRQGPLGRATRLLQLSEFKDFHKPKPFSRIWDIDIANNEQLRKQLEKRLEMYAETGGEIE